MTTTDYPRTFRLQISKQRHGYLAESLVVLPGGHAVPLAAHQSNKSAAKRWLEQQRDALATQHRATGCSFDVRIPWGNGQRYGDWPET